MGKNALVPISIQLAGTRCACTNTEYSSSLGYRLFAMISSLLTFGFLAMSIFILYSQCLLRSALRPEMDNRRLSHATDEPARRRSTRGTEYLRIFSDKKFIGND